jgi:hypothetical protein
MWFQTIAAGELPRLIELLGGEHNEDVLDVLSRFAGQRSYDLERLLRGSDIPISRFVY